ncbi:MAG: 4Fe-4S binding protein [Spirochaetales bacterium]|nr:4Fe-4S binding protein [Spirochaetales bacterium]
MRNFVTCFFPRGSKLLTIVLIMILFGVISAAPLPAEYRFPRPEFKSEYEIPKTEVPAATPSIYEYLDLFVLVVLLSIVSYLVLKRRSRLGIFIISIFSLIYLGFLRRGCICPIGSIQNVTLAIFDSGYIIPLTVIGFFLLPLIYTLLFGRSFCAGVCPFGALQDLVILRPVKLPAWLSQTLGLFPYVYLGTAVLFTATGSGFLICRFDPFVEIFRFGSRVEMLIFGGILLIIGIFIARPYCRFLCPYSVLLRLFSRFAIWHGTITPAECVNCKLCHDSCPVDAILPSTPQAEPESRSRGVKRLMLLLILIPLLTGGGAVLGSQLGHVMSYLNSDVRLQTQINRENTTGTENYSEDSSFFRESRQTEEQLAEQVATTKADFYTGGFLLGGFIALVFALKLISLSLWRKRDEYEIDKAQCVSCGRCFEYCPVEAQHKRAKDD